MKPILVLLLTTWSLLPVLTYASVTDIPSAAETALSRLSKASDGTLQVKWNPDTQTPSRLTGKLSSPSKHSPEWIAFEFLNRWKAIFFVKRPNLNMQVVKVEGLHDLKRVHLRHMLFQTPVWEDYLIIDINPEGVIQCVEGMIHPHLEDKRFNHPMVPTRTVQQAIAAAAKHIQGELAAKPVAERYYLADRPGTPLVYVIKLQSRSPDQRISIMIHSQTGKVIQQINHG